jgi:uncharacterized protein with NRDE domain
MCLLLIALEQHPVYKLVLAANRDEYYDRPTAPAQFWEGRPGVLAGRDLKAGGTWLGITKTGRLSAITNYRDPAHTKENAPSRGDLVLHFLERDVSALQYLEDVSRKGEEYNGFNLLAGSINELSWYSNRGDGILRLAKGVYGVSNHLLDTPWPKIEKAKNGLRRMLTSTGELHPEDLFEILIDQTRPADELLPDTGVGLEWEKILSPVFISSPVYGTRSSTIILVDHRDLVLFMERTYNSRPDQFQDVTYRFRLDFRDS